MKNQLLARLDRLEAILLEAGGRQQDRLEADRHFVNQEAIRHLSTDELRLVIDGMEAQRQGRELTSPELAAAEAYTAALETECQKMGYKSFAEFHKSLRGRVRNAEEED
jgi:hypothetical protein